MSNSKNWKTARIVPRYCGEMRQRLVLSENGRIIDWFWEAVNGCGYLNHGHAESCLSCGRKLPEREGGE